jgi:hypothetical protein
MTEQTRMLKAALQKAVNDYGKPGGAWNIPDQPGTWIAMARAALEGDDAEYRSAVEQALDSSLETNLVMSNRLQLIRDLVNPKLCSFDIKDCKTSITMNSANFNALMELLR